MELQGTRSLFETVPAYLYYCARNPNDDNLVSMYTVNALAEYGRCKDPKNAYLNFKYLCNTDQLRTVREFLLWCKGLPIPEYENQIDRAVERWKAG